MNTNTDTHTHTLLIREHGREQCPEVSVCGLDALEAVLRQESRRQPLATHECALVTHRYRQP